MKEYVMFVNLLIGLVMLSMLVSGKIEWYFLVYLFMFIFCLLRTLVAKLELSLTLYISFGYVVILLGQIRYLNTVAFANHSYWALALLCKLIAVVFVLIPLGVNRFILINRYAKFYLPSVQELSVISFGALRNNLSHVVSALRNIEAMGEKLSPENIKEVIDDLPRHSSFRYICNGTLTEEYFAEAYSSLDDPYIYIIVSNTGSPASEMISVFSNRKYNHASLSFDSDLKTIISYNGGERVYPPGLNQEMLEFFNKKENASIIVYKLAASPEQKKKIIDRVSEINVEGSAYNMLGLALKFSRKPNIMFCSQFVYNMLKYAGLTYFEKKDGYVHPADFVEQDYYRKLEFAYEMHLHSYIKSNS